MEDEAVRQVTSALNKSFASPLGELGEFLADKVRFLRWKAAVKTLDRAREIAAENGGHLNVPPVKFLLPFLEGCSLEEYDEHEANDLTELWSNLLVQASTEMNSEHLVIIDVLKRMRPNGALIVRGLASTKSIDLPTDESIHLFTIKSRVSYLKANFENMLARELLGFGKVFPTEDTVFQALKAAVKSEPIAPAYATVPDENLRGVCQFLTFDMNEIDHDEFEFEVLARLGLLEFAEIDLSFEMSHSSGNAPHPRRLVDWEYENPYFPMEIGAYFITSFGLLFHQICSGKQSQ